MRAIAEKLRKKAEKTIELIDAELEAAKKPEYETGKKQANAIIAQLEKADGFASEACEKAGRMKAGFLLTGRW